MKKRLKVLLTFDSPESKPDDYDFKEEFKNVEWATEKDVYQALLKNGHKVDLLGINDDIHILIEKIKKINPDVLFNVADVFHGRSYLEKNIPWLVEMLNIPYTGASPTNLLVCNDKALSKKILSYHKIKVPSFYTFYRRHKVWLPKRLSIPLIVKPLSEEASRGIAQASIVDNESALVERVKFIHEKLDVDAIVEEYIDGRELYIGVIGNKRIKIFSPIEMKFGKVPEDEPRIATYKAKWDKGYREKWGIKNTPVGRLPEGLGKKINDICKRAYRALNMSGYARFDIRVTASAAIYILEANANPCLGKYEDFGWAAERTGIEYKELIQKILSLAFQRNK